MPPRFPQAALRAVLVFETYLLRDPPDCANPDRMRCLREVSVDMVLEAIARVTSERPHRSSDPRLPPRPGEG